MATLTYATSGHTLSLRRSFIAAVLIGATALCAPSSLVAAQGDCAQPVSSGATPTAVDALFILQSAVGVMACELCICDVDGNSAISATDALTALRIAVGGTEPLNCPGCEPGCGDGVIEPPEICDDGNASDDDDCTNACVPARCGDGIVHTLREECDDAGESMFCDLNCTLARCGDGTVNASSGEYCDERGEAADCDDDCSLVECGDATLNEAAAEDCDDGNLIDGDGCDSNCTETRCGNGVVSGSEQCDDAGVSADCDTNCCVRRL
jgi:cysteine-rich repeat protein